MFMSTRWLRTFLLLFFLADICDLSAMAQAPAFTATFRGIGTDVLGHYSLVPDGEPDFRITFDGLRGTPTSITVTSETGVWSIPFNSQNWIIQVTNQTSSSADIYFSQWPSSQFHVYVGYGDGSSDQADAIPSSIPSSLTATYRGVGADVVGTTSFSPDGLPDYWISLGGLRGPVAQMEIMSDNYGLWHTPFNGGNWVIATTNANGATADIYFAVWTASQFKVRVWYTDGSTDEADAAIPSRPSTLTATFRGTGPDVISPLAIVPDGSPDFRISLGGLRGTPSQISITSETGFWHVPFNGTNWIIRFSSQSSSTAELNFSQWPSQNFKVRVVYPDSSSDEASSVYDPTSDELDVVRFLQQATFGPTTALIDEVKTSGIAAYIDQQKSAPPQSYPDLPFWPQTRPTTCVDNASTGQTCARDNYTYYQIQKHFFTNALTGEDQLRQRIAFALSEILVTSQTDVPLPAWMRTYQQLLYSGAFGNFRQLLYDVTLNATMGRFLDMLNNRCQTPNPANANICRNGLTSQPNENYAREILQLFSIGTFRLDQQGNRILDSSGNPIPTYDQKTIEEFARVFTGWVLAPNLDLPPELAGQTVTIPNYRDPMVVHIDTQNRENWHDFGSKTLLNGIILPPGQTTTRDLNDAIDNIAFNANVAPFISKQLIQHLVTSNPSSAYVGRIADVFTTTNRSSDQLFQVVRAILLDPEARNGQQDPATAASYGKLREPVLLITNVIRAFGGTSDGVLNTLTVGGSQMGAAEMNQDLFNAPSVFNYFPPTARVPGEAAFGPEYAIFSSLSSLRRDNFIYRVVFLTIPVAAPNRPLGTSIDLAPFDALAANPGQLLDKLNTLLLGGSMSTDMRGAIEKAVSTISATNLRLRVRTAVYLILTSSQYQVER
jgi:uncharacterized protein (DUF1800 family)